MQDLVEGIILAASHPWRYTHPAIEIRRAANQVFLLWWCAHIDEYWGDATET